MPSLPETASPGAPAATSAASRALPEGVRRALVERRVLVVMPAHDEEASVGTTIEKIHAELLGVDVVVVNDASTDRTTEVAEAASARVIELPCNLGYGGAVQAGFKFALAHGYDYVVQMDADGQHDPASAAALLAPVVAGETDVTIGSRFLGRATYDIPGLRRVGMAVFARIVTWVTRQRFSDPTSGFQALRRPVVEFFARDNYPTDFPDADTLILLALAGFKVREVPVTMRAREAGVSMHSNLKAFYYVSKMFLSISMVLLRHKMLRAKS